jgi:hypothetical protein
VQTGRSKVTTLDKTAFLVTGKDLRMMLFLAVLLHLHNHAEKNSRVSKQNCQHLDYKLAVREQVSPHPEALQSPSHTERSTCHTLRFPFS